MIADLDQQIADLRAEVDRHRYAADILESRIQGLLEAREWFAATNGVVEPPKQPRRRRTKQEMRDDFLRKEAAAAAVRSLIPEEPR